MRDPEGRAFSDILDAYLSRRSLLKATWLTVGTALLGAPGRSPRSAVPMRDIADDFSFHELRHGVDESLHVSPGYEVQVLIRWGDPVLTVAYFSNGYLLETYAATPYTAGHFELIEVPYSSPCPLPRHPIHPNRTN